MRQVAFFSAGVALLVPFLLAAVSAGITRRDAARAAAKRAAGAGLG
jgi:hypothetical protein